MLSETRAARIHEIRKPLRIEVVPLPFEEATAALERASDGVGDPIRLVLTWR